MKKIEIFTTSDTSECETCGMDWAEGGVVYVDEKKILEIRPVSHCCGGVSVSESELLVLALSKLGISVRVDNDPFHVSNTKLSKELL